MTSTHRSLQASTARSLLAASAVLVTLSLGCGDDDVPPPVDAAADAPVADAGPPACRVDPATFPAPVTGACTATVNVGADLPAGDDGAGGVITPGGRRVTRVGNVVLTPGFPMRVVLIPGTRFAIVTDGGIRDEHLSVIDLDARTVVYEELFTVSANEAVFLGLAVSADGTKLWASGGGSNRVFAYDINTTTGALTAVPARDIVPATAVADGYVSGLALLADGTLAVNLMMGDATIFYDTATRTELRRATFENNSYPYDAVASADGATVFVSMWGASTVVPISVATGAAGTPIVVGKNAQGLSLSPDGSKLAVASADGDSVSVIDVAARTVTTTLDITGADTPRGSSPTAVDFGPDGTLYVVCAGDNAIDVYAPAPGGYTHSGRIPTTWYPTDVLALADGRVIFTNGKHAGTGPNDTPATTDILDHLEGSVTIVDATELTPTALADWETEIATNNDRGTRFNEVTCPAAAPYDFPIPQPGTGPSAQIEHVILVVRENKTFDAYFGDLPGVNGDPALTILPAAEMEDFIPNSRTLARTFTHADNYYSGAEQSVQGHVWTTLGRTTDFVERSWLTTWGRGYWAPPPQLLIEPIAYPEEGSIFDWLERNSITRVNYGEVVGARAQPVTGGYPGLVFNTGVLDRVKAAWVRRQWENCNLKSFTYIVLPNDHTLGGQPGAPTPRSMIADNDEGVGMLADALSHSSFWPTSLLIFIQDDPQDGGDHVDNHRSPAIFVSPWVRRGHVSSVHYNESSIYRTVQQIFGVADPLNAYWVNAAPLYDVFSSTPDYTPYDYIPRREPEATNPAVGASGEAAPQWDFSHFDEQPGLSRWLWQQFHRGAPAPWQQTLDVDVDADGI
jgi:YVTN family beta-propeller protein